MGGQGQERDFLSPAVPVSKRCVRCLRALRGRFPCPQAGLGIQSLARETKPLWSVSGDTDRAPRGGGRGRARNAPQRQVTLKPGPRDGPSSSHSTDSPAGPAREGGGEAPGRPKFWSFQNRRKSSFVRPRLMINNPRHGSCPRHRPWGAAGLGPPREKGSGGDPASGLSPS